METFNIFEQTRQELDDFFTKKVKIGGAVVNGIQKGGFDYSQWETLQSIEFVDNSKFLSGEKDSEGQTKFFLNTASFRKEVASKNIDLDVKNFNFIPEEGQSDYGAIIARKRFRNWAKEYGLSRKINDTVDRFPKYGTVVGKKVGNDIEIIPLLKIRNQQDAKSLAKASFVTEEHELTIDEMSEYKGWNTKGLKVKWGEKVTVYERYGNVPVEFYNDYKKGTVTFPEGAKSVYCVTILTLDKSKAGKTGGEVLFMEETECPYIEEHYARQDGRWLGIGEIEKQLDNQAARNMIFNLRKKNLAWSAKNIFQTSDDTAVNNLVTQVRDGDVLKVDPQGGFERVDTASRAAGDFSSMDSLVEENSNQRSFTFEVATGESMSSGTPFRLGALLGNSVNSYYDKKREQLGFFWKDIVWELMIPMFEKDTEEEFVERVFDTEEGFDELRQAKRDALISNAIVEAVIRKEPVDMEAIKLAVDSGLAKVTKDSYKMTKKELKSLKYKVELDITGESVDVAKKIETLTNLYQSLLSMQDVEGAKAVLKRIISLTGEKMPITTPMQPNIAPTGSAPRPQGQSTMPSTNVVNPEGATPLTV